MNRPAAKRIGTALLAGAFLAFLALEPTAAFAASVTVEDPITVILPSDNSTYLLGPTTGNSTGTFDQLNVNGGTLTFTLSAGESVLITASNDAYLSNSAGLAYSCGTNSSALALSATDAETVAITPTGTCSAGGGGGSSGSSPSAPSTPSTPATSTPPSIPPVSATTTPPAVPPPPSAPGATISAPQVAAILSLLSSFEVDPSVIAQVQAILNNTNSIVPTTVVFTRNLTVGSSGADVAALQTYLDTHGFPVALVGSGSFGQESTFFGSLTKTALAQFQRAAGITPTNGYFGAKTRAYLESHP